MRIALFDHSYHQKTLSTKFIHEIMESLGTLSIFYDETWINGTQAHWSGFDENHYDLIVILQVTNVFDILSGRHKNMLFIPMYDGMLDNDGFIWKDKFNTAKILSFSWKLHEEVTRRGAVSKYVRYYPKPDTIPPVTDYNTLVPFFWYRKPPIDLALVNRISPFTEGMWLHNSPDPGAPEIDALLLRSGEYKVTSWFTTKLEYQHALSHCNIFFAPRVYEGIGQSYLEAMAAGCCVVAPDTPTMNEYISNGTTGLLYSIDRPSRLDYSKISEIGPRARESVQIGYLRWIKGKDELLKFITTPIESLKSLDESARVLARISASDVLEDQVEENCKTPKVSIVVILRNDAPDIVNTINSISSQSHKNTEYVVLDSLRLHSDGARLTRQGRDHLTYEEISNTARNCTGEWVLFMNAGDTFVGPNALARLLRHASSDTDVLYGHHLQLGDDGVEELRTAADFGMIWSRLQIGHIDHRWLSAIPVIQSTILRKSLLEMISKNLSAELHADLELTLRARACGAVLYNTDEIVTLCRMNRLTSPRAELLRDWLSIARRFSGISAENNLRRSFTDAKLLPESITTIYMAIARLRVAEICLTVASIIGPFEKRAPWVGPLSKKLHAWGARQWEESKRRRVS